MKVNSICLLTKQVDNMIEFYKMLFEREPDYLCPIYGEFRLDGSTLCVFDINIHNEIAPGSASLSEYKNFIVELEVPDVEQSYVDLKRKNIDIVKSPTLQSWGTKSVYFKDPDDNLINYYTKSREGNK